MSSRIERGYLLPELQVWAMLGVVLAVGIFGNWAIAGGLLGLFLIHLARPFDVIVAFLVVVGGSALVSNSGGALTFQLALLSAVILLMLACYVLKNTDRLFSVSRTELTLPLALLMLCTLANAVRGVLVNSSRFVGLELVPLLGLGTALLVANAFEARRDLRLATVGIVVIGFVCAMVGFREPSLNLHAANTYTMAFPGIAGLLLINLALRARSGANTVICVALSAPLFLHQMATFGRGLWTGGLAGLAFSFWVYGGAGPGWRTRWARCGFVLGTVIVLGLLGIAQMAVLMRRQDLLQDLGARMASTTDTKVSYETRSNLIRLWEYATAIGQIRTSPWIGHGLGFTFPNKEPFSGKTFDQWYVHQSFIMIWLKQGVLGLALFLWTLWTATVMSARSARGQADPWVSAWFTSTGAATIFLAVFSLSNFPFALVNEMFLLALLWGGSMAMVRKGFVTLRWRSPAAEMLPMHPSPEGPRLQS